jgi:excisionase family DNA binding protein
MRHALTFISNAPPVIRLREVAAMVGLSPRTLRRQVAAGEMPAFKIGCRNRCGDWVMTHAAAASYICRVLGLPPLPPIAMPDGDDLDPDTATPSAG